MQAIADRYHHLFCSTKGLVLVAIALVSLVTVVWGMLSGPMAELGFKDVVVRLLGMDLVAAEREGRRLRPPSDGLHPWRRAGLTLL